MRRIRYSSKRRGAAVPQLVLTGIDAANRAPTALSRATSRRKTCVEAPAPKPWLAIVLAVDTAQRSGWCITVTGRRVDSGELDTLEPAELGRVVQWAVDLGAVGNLPVVLVLEAPWGGNIATLVGLGAARERWQRAWRDARQAAGRVVRVTPNTWRAPVLGGHYVSAPRDETRAQEQLVARACVGRVCGPDEAAAILIARWAAHAAPVGRAIGKRASKASLKAWTQRGTTTA